MAKSERIQTGAGMVDFPLIPTIDGQVTPRQFLDLTDAVRRIASTVNGRLTLGDGTQSSQSGNIDGHTKRVTFTNANADYEVPHELGRTPIGILLLYVSADGAVVRSSNPGSWNNERMLVRCNVAGTTALFVVV